MMSFTKISVMSDSKHRETASITKPQKLNIFTSVQAIKSLMDRPFGCDQVAFALCPIGKSTRTLCPVAKVKLIAAEACYWLINTLVLFQRNVSNFLSLISAGNRADVTSVIAPKQDDELPNPRTAGDVLSEALHMLSR